MQIGSKYKLRNATLLWANQGIEVLDGAVSGIGIPPGASGPVVQIDTVRNRVLLALSWKNVQGIEEKITVWIAKGIIGGSFDAVN